MNERTGNTPKIPSTRFNIDDDHRKNHDPPGSFGVLAGSRPLRLRGWIRSNENSSKLSVFAASFTADWQQLSFKEPSFRHNLAATEIDPEIIEPLVASEIRPVEAVIVGGVNLVITVNQYMNAAKLGVLSPTSACHTFDESSDGYGWRRCCWYCVSNRLPGAVRDRDSIRGVIRSSAVNSNGKVSAVGIIHPNREGQVDVKSRAYKWEGDLDPRLTGYFERHGIGTVIGDPPKVHAVSLAMSQNRKPGADPLWIGAVKTNIGHSRAAAGLSALIKALLIVDRSVIPPTRGVP
ncbi:thiolase-like protein [Xylariaceae sp. FL1651]|nr:thiolase-like protein [Xylariaceae sp. FL1651]